MEHGILLVWYVLVAGSLIFAIYDSITNTPVNWVQKLAWILVIFYTGPVGLFLYLLACRSPGSGMHDAFTSAHWKQAVNSEMHCLAGDATGIVLAAIVVSFFILPNGVDVTVEYVSAFLFGLLIFQALMMKSMFDNDYFKAVRKTVFAETVSMNMVMIGMIPTMIIMKHLLPHGRDPREPMFWFVMGMATIVGGATAYPINSWLVKSKLKHGCMTLPEKDPVSMAPGGDHYMSGMHHEMTTLSTTKAVTIAAITFLALLIAAWLTNFVAPISFTVGEA